VTSVAEWGEKWASGRAAGSNAQYSALRFDPDAIIDGGTNALLAAQIPLGRFRTADFAWSRSGSRNTVFGTRLFFFTDCFFAICRGLLDRRTTMAR
jgi:hypothetical protein